MIWTKEVKKLQMNLGVKRIINCIYIYIYIYIFSLDPVSLTDEAFAMFYQKPSGVRGSR